MLLLLLLLPRNSSFEDIFNENWHVILRDKFAIMSVWTEDKKMLRL
jgi:hypothetical protein